MKFRVTGQNRETGARQVLEFEAESRGAAERKAMQAGMSANRIEDISDGEPVKAGVTPGGSMRPRRGGSGGVVKLLVGIILLLGIAYALYYLGIIKI
jgi:ABC-type glucose/galactose transport system permease subunit